MCRNTASCRILIVDPVDQRLRERWCLVRIQNHEVRLEVGRLEPEGAGRPVRAIAEELAAEAQLALS